MYRIPWFALLGGVLMSGCALNPEPGMRGPDGSAAVQRVETGDTHVSALVVTPTPVGSVQKPGYAPAKLQIGAFYARLERVDGPVDQLSLMLEVQGPDALELVRESRQLLLQVDGELFTGEPGVSENSFRVSHESGGTRATLAIPVTPRILLMLADAREVRGRLGLWGSFTFPQRCRGHLKALLHELPPDAHLGTPGVRSLARVAQGTE